MALMFENLTTRLNGVLDRLKRRGALSEGDVIAIDGSAGVVTADDVPLEEPEV